MAEISFNINENVSTISTNRPILKEGFASCIRCGNTGVKDTFYGRGKQFCSSNCVKQGTKSISNQQAQSSANLVFSNKKSISINNTAPSFSHQFNKQLNLNNHNQSSSNQPINNQSSISNPPNILSSSNNHLHVNQQLNSTSNQQPQTANISKLDQQQHLNLSNQSDINKIEMKNKTNKLNGKSNSSFGYESQTKSKQCSNSFDWLPLLNKDPTIKAAPVSSFKHVPIADLWNQLVSGELKVEVKNRDPYIPPDCKSTSTNDYYWVASLIKTEGYFLLLRFEGYEDDSSADFWINIYSSLIHPVGWSAANHKLLVPPRKIIHKQKDWKEYLYKELKKGCKTLPDRFVDQIKESLKSNFRLEVLDKKRLSSVRLATINKIIGNRLHVIYDGLEDKDNGFWCHQQSSLIHPIGWAMLVGHELRSTSEYAINSLEKVKTQKWAENDADFSYFPHLGKQMIKDASKRKENALKFKKEQKLEAIDPLGLSNICPATVCKVLRYNYIMVGIDGMMQGDGSDWFCYHTSSGNIFPVGSCEANKLTLTSPKDYPKPFNWFNYLKENKAEPVPVSLFNNDLPKHGFEEGMYLEAVDLMEPRLICVAQIVKVVGRLLKIHFNGWDDSFDQWCDCESVEIYPLGWCSIVGYPLEPPKSDDNGETSSGLSVNSFVFDNTIKKRNKQAYKGGRSKKRKRNTLSISENLNGSRDEEDQLINSNSNFSNDDQDNCSLFNLTTESNDINEQQNQLNETNEKEEYKATNITANSKVTFKPSPLINNNVSSCSVELDKPVMEWRTEDVINYFQKNDCGNDYLKSFKERNIDGEKLIGLKKEDVFLLFDNKLGPSLKAIQLIQELKETLIK